jgi:ankyrin repeat protein
MAPKRPTGFFARLKEFLDWDAPDDPGARLMYYVENGRVDKVKASLGSIHLRSSVMSGDPSPLQVAAARGDPRMVELLLAYAGTERGARTLALRKGPLWRTPENSEDFALEDCPKNALALARLSGDRETYAILLKDAEQAELDWALYAATLKKDLPWMTELAERGASPNAPDVYRYDGWTPFLRAVGADFLAGFELLLEKGGDLRLGRCPPDYGHDNDVSRYSTPLYLSCVNGNARIAEKLLAAGADPDRGITESDDARIRTPLMAAFDRDDADLGRLLVERGADPALLAGKWHDGRSVREEQISHPRPGWDFLAAA